MAKAKKKVAKKKVFKKKLPPKTKGPAKKAPPKRKKVAKKRAPAKKAPPRKAAPKRKAPAAPGGKAIPARRVAPPGGPEGAPKVSTSLVAPERLVRSGKAPAELPVPAATKAPVRPDDFRPAPSIGEPSPAGAEE